LPARSFTPEAPPVKVAVYVAPDWRDATGSSCAVVVALSYVTVADTAVPTASRRTNVELVTVLAVRLSENVAVTMAATLTFVAPLEGDVDVTCGGVVSGSVAVTATSTQ